MDVRGLNVAETCRLSSGESCTPCRQYIKLEELLASGALDQEAIQSVGHVSENKRRLRSDMNDQHDPLISGLPLEIISHIFLFTLDRIEAEGFMDYFIDSPLFLGRICQSWREIAWSTPSLWNWMYIILRSPHPSGLGLLVKEWLDRAGNLPLTIHIDHQDDIDDDDFPGSENLATDFIDHINQRSSRWENVSFKVPQNMSKYITGSPDGYPNLRVLRAQTTDGGDFEWVLDGPPPQPFHMAYGRWQSDPLTTMGVDWTNLTTVYTTDIYSSECIHLVRHAPRLVHTEFYNVFQLDTPTSVDTPTFVHPSLQVFVLKSSGAENVERQSFLNSFTFPQLIELRLHPVEAWPTCTSRSLWTNSIQPFIIRSSSRLTELSLYVPFTSKSLIATLGAIPSLQVLVLNMALQAENETPGGLRGLLAHIYAWKSKNEEGVSPFTKFLPNLTKFMYYGTGGFQSDLDLPWVEFMDILGPLSEIRNPQRHPNDKMSLNLGPMFPLATFHTSLNYDIFEDFGPGNSETASASNLTSLLEHLIGDDVVILEWNYSPFKRDHNSQ